MSETMGPATILERNPNPDMKKKISFCLYSYTCVCTTNTMRKRSMLEIALNGPNENGGHYFTSAFTEKKLHFFEYEETHGRIHYVSHRDTS